MSRSTRVLASLVAAACVAGLLFPIAARASGGTCLGRAVTHAGDRRPNSLGGTAAEDVISGFSSDDAISAGRGDDRVCAGNGDDFVSGDSGNDLLRGKAGDDFLVGGPGADVYNGGPGRDICDLGPGDRSTGGCEFTPEDDPDRDGLMNALELALRTSPFLADTDGDGTSDVEEATGDTDALTIQQEILDNDGDSIRNEVDNCVDAPNLDQANLDQDAQGDACDSDDDADDVTDESDNCPVLPNPDQSNIDKDPLGDACDPDDDGDQIDDVEDLCPTRMHGDRNYGGCPPLVPSDGDGDGVMDALDNCLALFNPGQEDLDGSGVGDRCEDMDGDTIGDTIDNCPDVPNPLQENSDGKRGGDACDVPTFEEFFNGLLATGFGIICFFLGGDACEEIAEFLYWLLYGVGGPPCICPPPCVLICGPGGLGGIGGIGII